MNTLPENIDESKLNEQGGSQIDLQVAEKTQTILSNQLEGMKKQDEEVNFTELEQRVINELDRPDVPSLAFLASAKVLLVAQDLLEKLLKIERKEFHELLETPNEEIKFDIFSDNNRLDQLFNIFYYINSVNASEESRTIIEEFQPKLIEFSDEIGFSKRFYDMHIICRKRNDLTSEQIRILDLAIKDFERNGINLPEDKQDRLKEINQKTADLSFNFGKNVLDSEKAFEYIFVDDSTIKEMPQDIIDGARELAKEEGKEGYKFTSSSSDYVNVMKYCTDSEVRRYFFEEAKLFGTRGELDNRPIILELLTLRKEESEILDFENYGELSLDTKMAQSPEEVISQEARINERVLIKAKSEIEEIKDFFNLKEINVWDLNYYSRLLKEQKYSIDDKVLREYFQYETVLEGMFNIAKILFDVDMKRIERNDCGNLVEAYEAYKGGELKGYFVMDMYYNPNKESGAWSGDLRKRNLYKGEAKLPIVKNVCSFSKLEGVTLLNHSDVRTMFHEFGHALHSLLSESIYSQLSGNNVEWDFIELPSQLMENWCEGEGLKFFAVHNYTKQVIPEDLLERLTKLKTFQKGLITLRVNAASKMDMILHTGNVPATIYELDELVMHIVSEINVFDYPKYLKPHASFGHVFDGGYAAGFYSYLRAEIIEAEVFSEFKKNGIFDKTTAERYLNTILSQGTRKPAIELFRDFIGRAPSIDAYLEKQGF